MAANPLAGLKALGGGGPFDADDKSNGQVNALLSGIPESDLGQLFSETGDKTMPGSPEALDKLRNFPAFQDKLRMAGQGGLKGWLGRFMLGGKDRETIRDLDSKAQEIPEGTLTHRAMYFPELEPFMNDFRQGAGVPEQAKALEGKTFTDHGYAFTARDPKLIEEYAHGKRIRAHIRAQKGAKGYAAGAEEAGKRLESELVLARGSNMKLNRVWRDEQGQFHADFDLQAHNQDQIPKYGDGGIVTKPTLAIVGEKGPEAIVPLTGAPPQDQPSQLPQSHWAKMAGKFSGRPQPSTESSDEAIAAATAAANRGNPTLQPATPPAFQPSPPPEASEPGRTADKRGTIGQRLFREFMPGWARMADLFNDRDEDEDGDPTKEEASSDSAPSPPPPPHAQAPPSTLQPSSQSTASPTGSVDPSQPGVGTTANAAPAPSAPPERTADKRGSIGQRLFREFMPGWARMADLFNDQKEESKTGEHTGHEANNGPAALPDDGSPTPPEPASKSRRPRKPRRSKAAAATPPSAPPAPPESAPPAALPETTSPAAPAAGTASPPAEESTSPPPSPFPPPPPPKTLSTYEELMLHRNDKPATPYDEFVREQSHRAAKARDDRVRSYVPPPDEPRPAPSPPPPTPKAIIKALSPPSAPQKPSDYLMGRPPAKTSPKKLPPLSSYLSPKAAAPKPPVKPKAIPKPRLPKPPARKPIAKLPAKPPRRKPAAPKPSDYLRGASKAAKSPGKLPPLSSYLSAKATPAKSPRRKPAAPPANRPERPTSSPVKPSASRSIKPPSPLSASSAAGLEPSAPPEPMPSMGLPSASGLSPAPPASPLPAPRLAPVGLPGALPSPGGAGALGGGGAGNGFKEFLDAVRELKDVIREWKGIIDRQKQQSGASQGGASQGPTPQRPGLPPPSELPGTSRAVPARAPGPWIGGVVRNMR